MTKTIAIEDRVTMRTIAGQTFRRNAAIFCAATTTFLASPALADASAEASASITAASADIARPIDQGAREERPESDPRFNELFARWSALDTAGPEAFDDQYSSPGFVQEPVIQQPSVSMPSRYPLSASAGRISSDYGLRRHPVLGRMKQHAGIDIAAPTGTPVYATADGVVDKAYYSSSYGRVIYLDHGSDYETRYAHLSGMTVAAGQRVRKGDLIGYVGSTGRSTGPHLHYEIRIDGQPVNPMPFLRESETIASFTVPDASRSNSRARPGQLGMGGK
jgi:murein DD-endopeptidase MepM/ murein hydrolase activator NlpD